MPALAALGWGMEQPIFRQIFTMKFLPEGSPEDWNMFNELPRRSTAGNAARFLRAFHEIDVADLARQVHVPTLFCLPAVITCRRWTRGGDWPP